MTYLFNASVTILLRPDASDLLLHLADGVIYRIGYYDAAETVVMMRRNPKFMEVSKDEEMIYICEQH